MIKAFTAFTNEIDEADAAVSELLAQLNLEGRLLRHSLGLVSCYAEYIDSGVVKALSDALPFDVIGSTTLASYVKGASGPLSLTLTVLTSDDVYFVTGLTEDITSAEDLSPLRAAYDAAQARLGERPKFLISFAPLLINVGGDSFTETIDGASGGVPNFGTVAVDHTEDYSQARTLYNGEAHALKYAFALVAGNVAPRFFVATLPPDKVGREKGIVTASAGNQLREIDGAPAIRFLERLGLVTKDGNLFAGMNTFPFVIDFNDNSPPVVRVAFSATPEGYAVCGGNFPVGSTIAVGRIDADDVVNTTSDLVRAAAAAAAEQNSGFLLMFSCVGRYLCMGYEPEREWAAVSGILDETGIPYHLTYSGGELCPTEDFGKLTNHNHNDTYIICAL
ncbi:MAG: FIST C-terminal domain-containing protein [Clostridiales bacterium]|jgi:hypothetical protein|nr:FIST C-terminal domain-containing protein [Clostridiales bacterium]